MIPALASQELHVWCLKINDLARHALDYLLSRDELERAARFTSQQQRAEFVICRAALRRLLGRYLGTDPTSIDILVTPDGKPYVERSGLQFNLSHSTGYAVFAFARDFEVGADIEHRDPGMIDQGTVAYSLTAGEFDTYGALPDDGKLLFFFDIWCRKEAYLKMLGDGFAISPSEIDVPTMKAKAYFANVPEIDGYSAIVAANGLPRAVGFYKLDSNFLR